MSKVLSVDDSAIIRKIIRGAADVLGYELLEAGNGSEALDLMTKEHQNLKLIMLDWNMPIMNGFETLKALKGDSRYKDIPVMMVTTEGEKSNIVEAVKAGARHYVVKPFTPEDLMARMMEAMELG
jgi:two-component system, chemotaxis family, chemotaxis protein CheY